MLNSLKKLFSAEPVSPVASKLPGRNEPCHCGSTTKYKSCCMPKDVRKGIK